MSQMQITVGATDAASPVIRKIRRESDKLGESLRRAATLSGRIGGAGGSLASRVLGSAGMGGAGKVAAVGIAATAGIGLVLRIMSAASERQVRIAERSLQIQHSIHDIQRNAARAMEAAAAGSVGMVPLARKRRALGSRGTKIADTIGSYGAGMEEATSAAAILVDSRRSEDWQSDHASTVGRLVRAGMSATDAARAIVQGKSPEDALTRQFGGNRDRAEDAWLVSQHWGSDDIEAAQRQVFAREQWDLGLLTGGRTATALGRQNAEAMDGGESRAMAELRLALDRQEEALRAAYLAQSEVGKIMGDVASRLGGGPDRFGQLEEFGAARGDAIRRR
jgi:hypothetical protein